MAKIQLHAEPREILGKEVKQLRQQGILPAHLYGHNVPSLALQVERPATAKVLSAAGSQLIELAIQGEKKARNVLIREVQRGLGGKLLHIDFYQVSMTEEITLPVSIVLMGESPLLKQNKLTLEQMIRELEVKCLPDAIPQSLEVDISSLTEVGHSVRIKDIKAGRGVTILGDAEELVAMIRAPIKEEEVKPAVVEEVKAEVEGEAVAEAKEAKEEKGEK